MNHRPEIICVSYYTFLIAKEYHNLEDNRYDILLCIDLSQDIHA